MVVIPGSLQNSQNNHSTTDDDDVNLSSISYSQCCRYNLFISRLSSSTTEECQGTSPPPCPPPQATALQSQSSPFKSQSYQPLPSCSSSESLVVQSTVFAFRIARWGMMSMLKILLLQLTSPTMFFRWSTITAIILVTATEDTTKMMHHLNLPTIGLTFTSIQ